MMTFSMYGGRGTDRGYSNGSQVGYLYMKQKKSVFLDKWILPVAGSHAINIFEWDLMPLAWIMG